MNTKQDIRSLTIDQLTEAVATLKEQPYRAKQLYQWIWQKSALSFDEMNNIPKKLLNSIADKYTFNSLQNDTVLTDSDGTHKIAFRLHDNQFVEGVLIPSSERTTACISTQIGCKLNCRFCATGKMGFVRDLSAGEIFEQVVELNKLSVSRFNMPLSNIVIMGMGEPLLNYTEVMAAIGGLTSPEGMNISPRRITLSTAGIAEGIKRLADDNVKFNLAISLNAPTNLLRSELMPVNKSNSLGELTKVLKYFNKQTGARITFEYILFNNVNDSLQNAHDLAEFCKNFPCKINIIEYNPIDDNGLYKSTDIKTKQFVEFMESKNLIVNVRHSKGKRIDAACGQLANKKKREKVKE